MSPKIGQKDYYFIKPKIHNIVLPMLSINQNEINICRVVKLTGPTLYGFDVLYSVDNTLKYSLDGVGFGMFLY